MERRILVVTFATKSTDSLDHFLAAWMAPSQLKQLRASLRENGLIGPSKSKKRKKKSASGRGDDLREKRQRNAALEGIREGSNPFEVKAPSRRAKFDVTSSKNIQKQAQSRPGVTKGLGEERVGIML